VEPNQLVDGEEDDPSEEEEKDRRKHGLTDKCSKRRWIDPHGKAVAVACDVNVEPGVRERISLHELSVLVVAGSNAASPTKLLAHAPRPLRKVTPPSNADRARARGRPMKHDRDAPR
jgi:hypothetical protein